MTTECWYTGHKLLSQPTKATAGYWKVTTEMLFPMSWCKKTWCHWYIPDRQAGLKKNHEPSLSCLFISEVLRPLFNIVTDWCWARPKTSFILKVLSFNTSWSLQSIWKNNLLHVYNNRSIPRVRILGKIEIHLFLSRDLNGLTCSALCWAFVVLSKGRGVVFIPQAFPFLDL